MLREGMFFGARHFLKWLILLAFGLLGLLTSAFGEETNPPQYRIGQKVIVFHVAHGVRLATITHLFSEPDKENLVQVKLQMGRLAPVEDTVHQADISPYDRVVSFANKFHHGNPVHYTYRGEKILGYITDLIGSGYAKVEFYDDHALNLSLEDTYLPVSRLTPATEVIVDHGNGIQSVVMPMPPEQLLAKHDRNQLQKALKRWPLFDSNEEIEATVVPAAVELALEDPIFRVWLLREIAGTNPYRYLRLPYTNRLLRERARRVLEQVYQRTDESTPRFALAESTPEGGLRVEVLSSDYRHANYKVIEENEAAQQALAEAEASGCLGILTHRQKR